MRFAFRHAATQVLSVLQQIRHLCTVRGWLVKRQAFGLLICERQVKPIPVFDQLLLVKFFLAMRRHLALASTAHTKAFFGMRQDNHWLSLMG